MGGFAALLPSGQPVEVSCKKNRALLTYLALHADKKVTREKLLNLLWSDRGDAQARSSLRQALVGLRRDLGGVQPPPLTISSDTVGLDGSAVSTDVAAFEVLAASASVEELRQAAKLYEGDLLDGIAVGDPAFDDWLTFERSRLREVAIGAFTRFMAHLNATEAITTGQRLVALDPLREASRRALMHAYAAQGQFEQAIRQYHYCRDTLRRELDVAPSAEMENLYREMREGRYLRQPAQASAEAGEPVPALAGGLSTSGARTIASARELATPAPARHPSVAVLVLANLSGDPANDQLCQGIVDDMIADMSRFHDLTAYDLVLRGNEAIAIAPECGRAYGGLSRVHNLDWRYSCAAKPDCALNAVPDPKAYELYLLARYYVTQYGARNQEIAFRFCQRAVEIDPNYARPWALAAVCQAFMYTKGRSKESGLSAAEHALSLDPNLAEAHAAKGRALCQLGHYEEAVAAHDESLRLEPDCYDVRVNFALTCMYMGRFEAAIEHYERGAQLLDADYASLTMAAGCNRALGRHDESKSAARRALIRIEKEIALRADNAYALVLGAIGFAYLEEKERGLEWVSRALTLEPEDAQSYYNLACALAQLDEPGQALDQLENYARTMAPERINWIKRDLDFAPLRREPRFQALIARCEVRLAQVQAERAAKLC
jgi:DNA-binding SARP family transcriptional activator/Flp pilus assembly protein TadD